MSKKEQLYFSLEKIIESRPSILRNSTLVLLLRIVSWVLMVVSFIMMLLYSVVSTWIESLITSLQDSTIPWANIGFLFSFIIFSMMLRLTKMIHKRNGYLLDIELWIEEYKAEARREE